MLQIKIRKIISYEPTNLGFSGDPKRKEMEEISKSEKQIADAQLQPRTLFSDE